MTHPQVKMTVSLIRTAWTVSAARKGVVCFAEDCLCKQLQSPPCCIPHPFLSSFSSPIKRLLPDTPCRCILWRRPFRSHTHPTLHTSRRHRALHRLYPLRNAQCGTQWPHAQSVLRCRRHSSNHDHYP